MKFYHKKGNKNYKERKLIADLEEKFAKKISENPEFEKSVVPATNYEELKMLHQKYMSEDVEVIEEVNEETDNLNNLKEDSKNINMAKDNNDIEDVEYTESKQDKGSNSNSFIDPFNREEPIVRDYVFGDDSMSKNGTTKNVSKTVFDEPTNFTDAFEIPDDEEEEGKQNNSSNSSVKSSESKQEPYNPNFDEMSAGKKRRSTKRFAKYIVEAVSTLSEKGFVWYANKDINDSKLAEYEMSGEMDLSLLVSLEDGQEVTVKQFFQIQCLKAEQLSKIPQEEKDDLADALAEVLMEKGVGPTPTQELILISLKIFGGQALTLMALKSQTNSLLTQLKVMKQQEIEEAGGNYVPKQPAYQPPSNFEVEQEMTNPIERDLEQEQLQKEIEVLESRDPLMIGDTVDTIE